MSSSADRDIGDFRGGEYDAIEQAVMDSPRGRWFLSEYAKRNRTADTRMLLAALQRLEDTLSGERPPESRAPDFATAILRTRAEIASVRNDTVIGGVIANDNEMFDRMAEESRRYAARFSRHSINLLETSAALRARFGDNTQLNSLDSEAHALSTLSVSNALLSERLVIALGLLSHFDHEVTPANDAEVLERETQFFSRDEDLFAAPAVASTTSDADRKRISITRHKTSEDIAIPLVEETLTQEA